jgi:hypothetical protein
MESDSRRRDNKVQMRVGRNKTGESSHCNILPLGDHYESVVWWCDVLCGFGHIYKKKSIIEQRIIIIYLHSVLPAQQAYALLFQRAGTMSCPWMGNQTHLVVGMVLRQWRKWKWVVDGSNNGNGPCTE